MMTETWMQSGDRDINRNKVERDRVRVQEYYPNFQISTAASVPIQYRPSSSQADPLLPVNRCFYLFTAAGKMSQVSALAH